MGHQEVPLREWEFWVASGKARAEVILPCLDGPFGCVAAMNVRWDQLEGDVVFGEVCLHVQRAFVVEDMKCGSETIFA